MLSITAVGNLGKDPEAFQAGATPAVKFTLAARTGKDETTWLNCVVFGARSATVLDYFKKGSKVTVTGKATQRFFDKKDGSPGSSIQVNVYDFTLPEKPAQDTSNVTPFPDKKSFDNNDQY